MCQVWLWTQFIADKNICTLWPNKPIYYILPSNVSQFTHQKSPNIERILLFILIPPGYNQTHTHIHTLTPKNNFAFERLRIRQFSHITRALRIASNHTNACLCSLLFTTQRTPPFVSKRARTPVFNIRVPCFVW